MSAGEGSVGLESQWLTTPIGAHRENSKFHRISVGGGVRDGADECG
jgi:hypothetical protein